MHVSMHLKSTSAKLSFTSLCTSVIQGMNNSSYIERNTQSSWVSTQIHEIVKLC